MYYVFKYVLHQLYDNAMKPWYLVAHMDRKGFYHSHKLLMYYTSKSTVFLLILYLNLRNPKYYPNKFIIKFAYNKYFEKYGKSSIAKED